MQVTRVGLIRSNLSAFARRLVSIREAKCSIDLIYYIWREDTSGVLLLNELVMAADRGVKVRVLIDALNFEGPDSLFNGLNQHENVQIKLYSPFYYGFLSPFHKFIEFCFRAYKLNRRLHIKCWVVDDKTAICGGRNIGDEYFGNKTSANFSDIDLQITGPSVSAFSGYFEEYWQSRFVKKIEHVRGLEPKSSFSDFRRELKRRKGEANQTDFARILEQRTGNPEKGVNSYDVDARNLKIVWDPPAKIFFKRRSPQRTTTVEEVFKLVQSTENEIRIVSPYFIPGPKGSKMLLGLAKAKKDVGILTNSLAATDAIAAHSGVVKYRRNMIENGIRLYELKPRGRLRKRLGILPKSRSSLHAKYLVVDRKNLFVGSFNIDPRSAWLNCEAGVVVADARLSEEILGIYREATDPLNSWQIRIDDGHMIWTGSNESGEIERFDSEPESSLSKKLIVWLISLLPVEPLL